MTDSNDVVRKVGTRIGEWLIMAAGATVAASWVGFQVVSNKVETLERQAAAHHLSECHPPACVRIGELAAVQRVIIDRLERLENAR